MQQWSKSTWTIVNVAIRGTLVYNNDPSRHGPLLFGQFM